MGHGKLRIEIEGALECSCRLGDVTLLLEDERAQVVQAGVELVERQRLFGPGTRFNELPEIGADAGQQGGLLSFFQQRRILPKKIGCRRVVPALERSNRQSRKRNPRRGPQRLKFPVVMKKPELAMQGQGLELRQELPANFYQRQNKWSDLGRLLVFAVNGRIVERERGELREEPRGSLRRADQEIAAVAEALVQALEHLSRFLRGKIHRHVAAKDQVKLAGTAALRRIGTFGEVVLSEDHALANARCDFERAISVCGEIGVLQPERGGPE